MRIYCSTEVRDAGPAASPALTAALDWIAGYLTAPHPDLGRSGAVCPYVRPALRADTLYLAEARLGSPSAESIDRCMHASRRAFLRLPDAQAKALVVSFAEIGSADAPRLLGGLLRRVKPDFVEDSLMLGPVYPGNEVPGAHNPAFRPMRGPLPLVAIRRLMETDLPFLSRSSDPQALQAKYVGAYLRHLGPRLSASRRAAAERALAQLEGTCS